MSRCRKKRHRDLGVSGGTARPHLAIWEAVALKNFRTCERSLAKEERKKKKGGRIMAFITRKDLTANLGALQNKKKKNYIKN